MIDDARDQNSQKFKRGLFIGRFQPYHYGHQKVIEEVAEAAEEIIIVIANAEASHTLNDPFTAGERVEMILGALGDLRGRCCVIPIRDINRYAVWVSHIVSMVPSFDIVCTNNHTTELLFKEAGFDVLRTDLHNRKDYSSTNIRKMMCSGEDWESLVPPAVAMMIKKIQGEERLKKAKELDKYREVSKSDKSGV